MSQLDQAQKEPRGPAAGHILALVSFATLFAMIWLEILGRAVAAPWTKVVIGALCTILGVLGLLVAEPLAPKPPKT